MQEVEAQPVQLTYTQKYEQKIIRYPDVFFENLIKNEPDSNLAKKWKNRESSGMLISKDMQTFVFKKPQ